jgi:hypothetical protein
MQLPCYCLPVESLCSFIERIRGHKVTVRISLPDPDCPEFECLLRQGRASVDLRGYRLGDELRFDFAGGGRFGELVKEILFAMGGSVCDSRKMLDGWGAVIPPES